MTCYTKPGLFGRRLTSRQARRAKPDLDPIGTTSYGALPGASVAFLPADGTTSSTSDDGAPLGGAVIGDGPETGVIDPYHRVYGHPGLHVVDGASCPPT